MEELNFRLDRTAFQALTFKEADQQITDSKNLSWQERVDHFNYLMSVAYGFVGKPWPKMDKTHFEMIKRS